MQSSTPTSAGGRIQPRVLSEPRRCKLNGKRGGRDQLARSPKLSARIPSERSGLVEFDQLLTSARLGSGDRKPPDPPREHRPRPTRRAYASAHTENPQSPCYTPPPRRATAISTKGRVERHAGDQRVARAPFHTIGMLRARLTQVAFAIDPTRGYVGLDVLQGLDWTLSSATSPICPRPWDDDDSPDCQRRRGAQPARNLRLAGWCGRRPSRTPHPDDVGD